MPSTLQGSVNSSVRSDLASARKEEIARKPTVESAELVNDALSAVAHELGSVASALDLRAAAMSRTIPEQDLAALRGLAQELRAATRALRLVRGPDAFGTLNPNRRQTLGEWWKLASRFTSAVLPRGVNVDVQFSEGELDATQASALTWIWLACCKDITDRGVITPCTVALRGGRDESGSERVTLVAEIDFDLLPAPGGAATRWTAFAANLADDLGVEAPAWGRDGTLARWIFSVDG